MPNKPGRKKIKLNDPDTLAKIVQLGSQGLTSGQIARCLGVSWSTIDRRWKENAEIEEAIKKGEALGVEKISNALMTSARDGNVTAQIFYLKNRAPDQWADRQEVNHNLDLAGILSNANSRILDVRPDEPGEQLNLQDARERTEANVRTNAQEGQDDYIDNSDEASS